MSKKAELMSRETILWAMAALALVVLAFAIFGPKLWGGATKAAFAFGIGALPDQEAPQLGGEVPIPPRLASEFNKLVDNINNAAADSCLVDITKLDGFEENWFIDLTDNNAILYRMDGIARLNKDTRVLNNFKPCTIVGSSAVNFYNRYLTTGEKSNLEILGQEGTITLSKNNRYEFLYKSKKPDESFQFCTFKFYSDSCKPPMKGGNDGIPDGCKSKMPQFESGLWLCKDMALAAELPKSELAKKDAQKIAAAIQIGISSSASECLVKYDTLSLDSWKIGMVQEEGKTKFVQVDNENNVGKLDVPIVNAVPCIITETLGTTDDDAKKGNLGPATNLQRIGIKNFGEKYKLTVNGPYDLYDNDYYFNIKDTPKYSALYKADSSHICFLPLHRDDNGNCDKTTNYIDDDCYIKDWVDKEKIFECSFLDSLNGVFLCDDEHCLDNPPTKPWRRTKIDIWSIEDVIPSPEDSEEDGETIEEQIGSIRIIDNYDIRLYDDKNYKRRNICFKDDGSYRLDDYKRKGSDGWQHDTQSVKVSGNNECTNPGITTIVEENAGEKLYLYNEDANLLEGKSSKGFSNDVPDKPAEIGNHRIFYFNIINNGDAIRFYEDKNYQSKRVCLKDSGTLFNVPISGGNTWEDDVGSFRLITDSDCTNPGVTEG